MDPVIFLEKVRQPGPHGLVRDRLLSAAARGRTGDEMQPAAALVLGPAGSGKTTLLSQLACVGGPIGWYRAGREDRDAATVTRYLSHALAVALDEPGLATNGSDGSIGDLIGTLEDAAPRPATLFIDDLQELAGSPAERVIETLLAMRPREITIVLSSRRPPLINTSRLIVSGDLLEIANDELRFRSWEVEQLFRGVYDTPLSPEGAAALTRRTGGWAAGLHLFHLATMHCGRTERERAIGDLGGRSRLIRSYLTRNVLDGLDSERLDFMVRTAALGVLTGDLCDELLHGCGSAGVLAALEDEQLFTSSSDGGVTYRYHHVLQTQLEVLLVDRLGGWGARDLYRRGAELLERDARVGAAVRAYARAEEWGSVARLLTAIPAEAEEDPLSGLLALPCLPLDEPSLAVAGARLLARRGRVNDAVLAYQRAEALLEDRPFNDRCRQERQSLQLWLPDAAVLPESALTDLSAVSVELRAVTRSIAVSVSTPLARGVQSLVARRPEDAVADLEHAASGEGWTALAARLAIQVMRLMSLEEETGAGQVEAIVLDAEVDGWPWLARIAHGVQLATLLAEAPDEWIGSAVTLLDSFSHRQDPWTELITAAALGVGLLRGDRPQAAESALARAAAVADRIAAPALRRWVAGLTSATALTGPTFRAGTRSNRVGDHGDGPGEAPVSLRCLGGFGLAVAGREIDHLALRPRARTLLMLLAMHHQRALHREQIIEQLWPDASLASGVRCLQVAVSSIRQCLAAAGRDRRDVVREGDAYALRIPQADDQLRSFEQLATRAQAADHLSALRLRGAALMLYTGDLLPEAGPAEWVVEERERLRRLATTTAVAAAADAAVTDPRAALDYAYRAVALDAYQDVAWDLIVECNSRLGNLAAAAAARSKRIRALADLGLAR